MLENKIKLYIDKKTGNMLQTYSEYVKVHAFNILIEIFIQYGF